MREVGFLGGAPVAASFFFALGLCSVVATTLPGCELQAFARIVSPAHGDFVVGDTVEVNGFLENLPLTPSTKVLVNGIEASIDEQDLTWTATVPLDQAAVFNRIVAEARLLGATLTRQQVTVIAIDGTQTGSTDQGQLTSAGTSLRLNNAGLDQIEPVVQDLAGDALDIGAIITAQNPLLDDECVISVGPLCVAKTTVNATDVGFGGFALQAESTGPASVESVIDIQDLFVDVDLEVNDPVSLISITCGLELTASTALIQAQFDLGPLPGNPRKVDVNLLEGIGVALDQLSTQFVSGICDDPLIGEVVDIIAAGLINDLLIDGFESNLRDPDGFFGPEDSPIADAIETTLAGIEIAQEVGSSIGFTLNAPIASIDEDASGFTLSVDAAVEQPNPLPSAPDLTAAYALLQETAPIFGNTTPAGQPYGLAFGISTSAMNQVLAALIEGGLLAIDLEEILLPLSPDPVPLDVQTLRFLIPEFVTAGAPTDPVVVEIRPTLAPILTGKPGPNGEMFEIKIGALDVTFRVPNNPDLIPLALNLTVTAGVDLAFTENGLEFELGSIVEDEIDVLVTENGIEADEAGLLATFEGLVPFFTEPLSDAIAAFSIPDLLGLNLVPVELARVDSWIMLYADLAKIPTATIQNVVVTDTSDADYRLDTAFDVEEWRHRIGSTSNATSIEATLKGFLGADACCALSDRQAVATAGYTVTFDIVSLPGESWELNLAHSINGAFDLKDDSVLLSDGGASAEFRDGAIVSASYSTSSGESGSFDFTPTPSIVTHAIGGSRSDTYAPFSGSNQVVLSGTADTSVTVDIQFKARARSDSNALFPTANGDKAGIRFGKQDTIDNHFNVGRYPGVGNRNIAEDGHFLDVQLTTSLQ